MSEFHCYDAHDWEKRGELHECDRRVVIEAPSAVEAARELAQELSRHGYENFYVYVRNLNGQSTRFLYAVEITRSVHLCSAESAEASTRAFVVHCQRSK